MAIPFERRVDYGDDLPFLQPDRVIEFDSGYSGQWLVAGDLDGDGEAELLTARNAGQAITAMSAYKLDGSLLWRWGLKGAGQSLRTYDVPAQIYDLDGDGRNEVVYGIEGFLIVAEGNSGRELARYPLPEGLEVADCVTFARLSRTDRASDILVKTRYTRIWAYSAEWKPLWTWEPAGGRMTCHHPTPVDLDGDGLDEVMGGYTMLGPDGRELWTYGSERVDLGTGHLDCCCVVDAGGMPEEVRLAVTACGANHFALLDGRGWVVWEIDGQHFESVEAGHLREGVEWDLVVDVDHCPLGESPTWIVDASGERVGTYATNYSRFHRLVDFDGDGRQEIVLAHARTLCDGEGNLLARFAPKGKWEVEDGDGGDPGPFALVGDMTGGGGEDIVIHTARRALVYENHHPGIGGETGIGTGMNFTLY